MASIQYVVNATDAASGVFAKIAASADGLDKQLEDLGRRVADPEVTLEDSKFTLGMIRAAERLDKLSAKVADPSVEVDTAGAQVEILRINAMLDRLDRKKVDVTVGVDRRGGLLGRLLGGGGGAAGAMGGLGGAAGAFGNLTGAAAALPAPALIGGIAAALAALPFAAAAAAGGIVSALGAGLTGLGVLAAAKTKPVKDAFHKLAQDAGDQMKIISTPLQGVLADLARTAQSNLPKIMTELGSAFQTIAPALDKIGKIVIKTLADPVVGAAIQSLADAFAAVLKALAPQMPDIIHDISKGIQSIASAIADHPQLFADFIKFLFMAFMRAMQLIGALTRVANWIIVHLTQLVGWIERNVVAKLVTFFTRTLPAAFDLFKNKILLTFYQAEIGILKVVRNIVSVFAALPGPLGAPFRKAKASIDDTLGRIEIRASQAANRIQGDFDRIHGKHVTLDIFGKGRWAAHTRTEVGAGGLPIAARGLFVRGGTGPTADDVILRASRGELVVPAAMVSAGAVDHLRGLIPGFAAGGIVPSYGPGAVRGLRGWEQHNTAVTESQIIAGVASVLASAWQKILNRMFTMPKVAAGGGVTRWAGLVLQVLHMLGQPGGDLGVVLSQMQTESGGNPFVVNKWDSNWARGTPSVGLMQVIGPTFGAYAGPFRGTGPFEYGVSVNPLANIYAGLNYAISRYGAAWTRVLGQGHGYDQGGWLPPGLSLAYNGTGRPERVGGGDTYHISVNVPPSANKADIGRQVVETILEYEKRSGAGWRR